MHLSINNGHEERHVIHLQVGSQFLFLLHVDVSETKRSLLGTKPSTKLLFVCPRVKP